MAPKVELRTQRVSDAKRFFEILNNPNFEFLSVCPESIEKEKDKIKKVLIEYGSISEQEMPVVLEAVKQASEDRIDLYTFTQEVSQDLSYEVF